jgi:osmotically-inducible protein OsmY
MDFNHKMKTTVMAAALTAVISTTGAIAKDNMSNVRPDNTRMNAVDRMRGAKTADDQSMASSDTDITRRIRHSLMQDKSITSAGKNIKVITNKGAVVLRGTVNTEAERHNVVSTAKGVAGASKITDEIRVVSND